MIREKVRSLAAAPSAEDFRSKDGTPLVVRSDTGALFCLLSSGAIFEIAGATADVVGDSITIIGGKAIFKAASSDEGIEVFYSSSSGKYMIGASNAAAPDLVLSNNAGTERARLTDAGEALVGVASANANGGCLQLKSGITFPATAVAATDANTLDDYEEGTWTPNDSSGASLSFTAAIGTYTKIGRDVVAQCTVIYPATASGANAVIGGLPFTIGASNAVAACYTTDGTATHALGVATTTLIALIAAAGAAARTNANLSGDTVAFTLIYEV